eukprot:6025052-Pyramimonas_sp.AAC.1
MCIGCEPALGEDCAKTTGRDGGILSAARVGNRTTAPARRVAALFVHRTMLFVHVSTRATARACAVAAPRGAPGTGTPTGGSC